MAKMRKSNKSGKAKKFFIGLAIICGVLFAAGLVFLIAVISKAPDISEIDATPHGYMTTVLDKDENVINHLSVTESNRIYVKLDEIPEHLQKAFIAIEDARFYKHGGIDIKGIIRAGFKGVMNGFKFKEGASTITQQLLKNNVFTDWMSEQTFMDRVCRKLQEQYMAIRLEQAYSKEWILENYLNTINLGGGTRGVQVAAQFYFGKDVSELTLAEATLIAGITKNPSLYNPFKNPEDSLKRQDLVLDAMLNQEMITKEQYDEAQLENVISKLNSASANKTAQIFSWFEDAMLVQIVEDLTTKYTYTEDEAWDLIYSGGLTIYSTQDTALQRICETVTTNPEYYSGAEQISVVVTDVNTGAVAALIGGREAKDSSLVYNRATSSIRQPGSTIKVIGEYAAALEEKLITLGTVIDDAPYSYSDGKSMSNSYSTDKGMITVRDAIAVSSNVVALKVFQKAGAGTVMEYLEKFGISTLAEEDRNEALSLGGTHNGVTNFEMTAAYNAIANDGQYVKPYYYTKIVNRDGKVILNNQPEAKTVVSRETAQLLTSAMQSVISSGTGTATAVKGVSLAGKSGTTNDNRDLWFIGFSSYYTCGIWGGNDDGSVQSGSGYVKQIWKAIMQAAHEGKENQKVFDGKDLSTATICKKCGNLAVSGLCENTPQGNMAQKEYFRAGEKPAKKCDCHVKYTICKDSNLLASSFCPLGSKQEMVYLKRGTSGTADAQYVIPEAIKTLDPDMDGKIDETLLESINGNGNTGSNAAGNPADGTNGEGTTVQGPGNDGTGNSANAPAGTNNGICNIHTNILDFIFPPNVEEQNNNGQTPNEGLGSQNNPNGENTSDGNQTNGGNNMSGGSQNNTQTGGGQSSENNGTNGDSTQDGSHDSSGDGNPNENETHNPEHQGDAAGQSLEDLQRQGEEWFDEMMGELSNWMNR